MKIDKVLGAFAITTCSAMIAIHCYATTINMPRQVAPCEEEPTNDCFEIEIVELPEAQDKSDISFRAALAAYRIAVKAEETRNEAERIELELRRKAEEEAREEAARLEAERIEDERAEAERIEAERLEAERIEAERIKAETIAETSYTPQYNMYGDIPLDEATQAVLFQNCDEFGVPYHIALGVIQAESTFRSGARNGNCVGYMQVNHINDGWLRNIGVTDIEDPHQNLRAGTYMLADFYNRYGDWHKALMCYNCGEGGAGSLFRKGYYSSTYSRTVMGYAESWEFVIAGK